ncbi:MAG: DUF4328 domain-containing protein [Alteraurantiacibacter sp.]
MAFLLVTGLAFIVDLVILARQLQVADPPTAINDLGTLVYLLMILLLLLATIPILLWVYRAHANLREASVAGLKYSPGWAAGSFLVPLANLVVPFRAMRELYNRSHGEPEDFAQSGAGPVTSWWACHIPVVMLYVALSIQGVLPLVSNIWVTAPPAATTIMGLFDLLLLMGSAWFLHQTIIAISMAQRHGVATANVFE